MQCRNCTSGLICPTCNSNDINRLNQQILQLTVESQRIRAETRRKITKYTLYISIPITITLSLASSTSLGKEIFDYIVKKLDYMVEKMIQRDTPSGGGKSPDTPVPIQPVQIQPNGYIVAREFPVEDSIQEVNLRVDVTCQTCTGQELVIYLLDEDEFQQFTSGDFHPPDDRGKRISNFVFSGLLKRGRYHAVLDNPSNHIVLVQYQTQLQ